VHAGNGSGDIYDVRILAGPTLDYSSKAFAGSAPRQPLQAEAHAWHWMQFSEANTKAPFQIIHISAPLPTFGCS
jgi:hypothetical protein